MKRTISQYDILLTVSETIVAVLVTLYSHTQAIRDLKTANRKAHGTKNLQILGVLHEL